MILYNDILFQPNTYIFNSTGDGIKNYYTADYYINHDTTLLHTNGLNYPFSELIVYTDNQPVISIVLKQLSNYIPSIKNNVIGIFNLLMLLSIVLSSYFLFKIARKLGLPILYSILISLIISYLSPQVERFTGHYGLSYSFFVPMIWCLLIKLKELKYKIKYYIIIDLVLLVFAFIHPYYLLIGSIFMLVYGFVDFIYSKSINIRQSILHFLFSILPIVLVQITISSIDQITDRPTNPWGILNYVATFEGLFLPVYSPLLDFWNMLVKVRETNIESRNYVGVIGAITLVLITIKAVKYLKKKKIQFILKPILPDALRTALLSAFLLLLFAMAMPFRIGFEFVLDLVPAIKQFRALGRFAWVFYYVFSLYSAFYFYLIFRKWNSESKTKYAYLLISFLMLIWMFEAYINNHRNIQIIANKKSESYKDYRIIDSLKKHGFRVDSFQSIVPLPGYFIGSEVIASELNDVTSFKSMAISASTGLPINSIMLSRTSFAQTLISAQLFSDSLNEKSEILKLLGNQKLLVVKDKSDTQYYYIESKSKYLFSDENLHYFVLNAQNLKSFNYKVSGNEFIINSEGKTTKDNRFVNYQKSITIDEVTQSIYSNDNNTDTTIYCNYLIKASNKEHLPRLYLKEYDSNMNLIKKTEFKPTELSNNTIDYIRLKKSFSIQVESKKIEIVVDSKSTDLKSVIISNFDASFLIKENNKNISVDNYPL
jgi:hypothetical protein